MSGGDFSEAEERSDEDEGVEFFGVLREDRFGDAGAEALTAENDLFVVMRACEFGFERAKGGGFNGRFGGRAGAFAIPGILEHKDIAGEFFDRMGPAAGVAAVAVKEEKAVGGCGGFGSCWDGIAFEAGEFRRAGGVGDEPMFESNGKSSVAARGHVDEFALGEEEEQADSEVGEDDEEQDFREERFGDDRGERHVENEQIPNARE